MKGKKTRSAHETQRRDGGALAETKAPRKSDLFGEERFCTSCGRAANCGRVQSLGLMTTVNGNGYRGRHGFGAARSAHACLAYKRLAGAATPRPLHSCRSIIYVVRITPTAGIFMTKLGVAGGFARIVARLKRRT
ncbi:unnamed protein product, partial [Iphiclides podalirius]